LRGRKPKPTSRQIAEGDPRKRGVNKLDKKLAAEPKAGRGLPQCPKHLGMLARAVWTFWKEELEAMRLDCRPDAQMLEGACVNYERAVAADMMLRTAGLLVVEPVFDKQRAVVGAKMKSHPAVAISNACWRNVRAFCSEFGLSPVSRTRLTIDRGDASQLDLMKMLSQPREAKAPRVQ